MPGMKLRRSAGNPSILHFEAASAFTEGDVLQLEATRRASRHSGGEADVLGIALADSAESISGKIPVLIPKPGDTFDADMPSGLASSVLSLGQTYGIYSVSGYNSYITGSYTSTAGRVLVIVGPYDSVLSRVEVSFNADALTLLASTTSQAIA